MLSFAHDHNERFPMHIPALQRGSMDGNAERLPGVDVLSFSARHFEAISNELRSAKLVVCPADQRAPAENFGFLLRKNISYCVYPRAKPGESRMFLAGDWNVSRVSTDRTGTEARSNVLNLAFNNLLHEYKGNVLFGDGHVELMRGVEIPLQGPHSNPSHPTVRPATVTPRVPATVRADEKSFRSNARDPQRQETMEVQTPASQGQGEPFTRETSAGDAKRAIIVPTLPDRVAGPVSSPAASSRPDGPGQVRVASGESNSEPISAHATRDGTSAGPDLDAQSDCLVVHIGFAPGYRWSGLVLFASPQEGTQGENNASGIS